LTLGVSAVLEAGRFVAVAVPPPRLLDEGRRFFFFAMSYRDNDVMSWEFQGT
jgi:hypothetical protein